MSIVKYKSFSILEVVSYFAAVVALNDRVNSTPIFEAPLCNIPVRLIEDR